MSYLSTVSFNVYEEPVSKPLCTLDIIIKRKGLVVSRSDHSTDKDNTIYNMI